MTWSGVEADLCQWALARVGVSCAEVSNVTPGPGQSAKQLDNGTLGWNIPMLTEVGVCTATDSFVLARTLQGTWAPRTPWLAKFVHTVNDVMHLTTLGLHKRRLCNEREGWWISHTSRVANAWSDAVAKWAKDTVTSCIMWIHDDPL